MWIISKDGRSISNTDMITTAYLTEKDLQLAHEKYVS